MKFTIFLTLMLHLTEAYLFGNSNNSTIIIKSDNIEPTYNIHEWLTKLNLQLCSFVEIGLKQFAIFVEDDHLQYFLGICNLRTLSTWKFCKPELFKQRKSKCCLRLRKVQYKIRVHRRFCDIQFMKNNPDCICKPTVFGEDAYKVIGFPTCYIAPSPSSLCKNYNVCGLSQCRTTTVEGKVYAVECDPRCKGKQPFCEYPFGAKTSMFPKVTSYWSEWQEVENSESPKVHSLATCVNKYTQEGAVDCLGPGTSCCSTNLINCSCTTYIEDGVLKLKREYTPENRPEKIQFLNSLDFLDFPNSKIDVENLLSEALNSISIARKRQILRIAREVEEYADDDDEEGDIDDDIKIEESEDEELPVPIAGELLVEKATNEFREEHAKPENITDPYNPDENGNRSNIVSSKQESIQQNYFIIIAIYLIRLVIT